MRRIVLVAALLLFVACSRGDREAITAAPGAPPAIGPYSQAVRVGDALYLAGQIGIDPATGALAPGGIAGQTRQALENCRAVLEAAGFTLADVVQAQVFLEDIDDFAEMMRLVRAGMGASPHSGAMTVPSGRMAFFGTTTIPSRTDQSSRSRSTPVGKGSMRTPAPMAAFLSMIAPQMHVP